MSRGIDLLAGERAGRLKQEKRAVKIRLYSLLAALIFALASAGIFADFLFLQKANNDLEQQLTVKKAAINDLKNLEGLQTVFVQRLFSLDKLLAKKDNDIYLLLDWLQKNMQSNVSLVKLTQKDKLVSLYLEASDAPAFNTFMNAFSEEIKQETFPFQNKIEITSVNRTKEGLYDLVISLANQPASHEPEK